MCLFDRSVDECMLVVWMTGLVVDGVVELLLYCPRFWIDFGYLEAVVYLPCRTCRQRSSGCWLSSRNSEIECDVVLLVLADPFRWKW